MELEIINQKIYTVRNVKVMLDKDLAELYEVETRVLKQAVRRSLKRFPPDFLFELTKEESDALRSQFVTLKVNRGEFSKYLPFAFTELGIAMLSTVLNSEKAIQVNIAIMRAFVLIRQYALTNSDLTKKLNELELRYDQKFSDIHQALNYLIQKDKKSIFQKQREKIGFKNTD
jgi:hypothetical protein